jgi:hypothetical protein
MEVSKPAFFSTILDPVTELGRYDSDERSLAVKMVVEEEKCYSNSSELSKYVQHTSNPTITMSSREVKLQALPSS